MDDWVLDSLVGFLKSPTWSLAVGGFTDKNCVGEYSSAKTLPELVVCSNSSSNCSCMPSSEHCGLMVLTRTLFCLVQCLIQEKKTSSHTRTFTENIKSW